MIWHRDGRIWTKRDRCDILSNKKWERGKEQGYFMNYQEAYAKLEGCGQTQVLRYYEELGSAEQESLQAETTLKSVAAICASRLSCSALPSSS